MNSTLFYEAALSDYQVNKLTYATGLIQPVGDGLGPYTQVDLADGTPNDWELGVAFLPGMDEVRVDTARLDLRGLRVRTPAEGWTSVAQAKGWKITLAQPARLVAVAFDPPEPDTPLAGGQTLRLLVSPASPPGPPAFIDPAFALGAAYDAIPSRISQRTEGGRVVAQLDATFGTSWLLQWGVGDDATELAPVGVKTSVRAVTVERAVADARLELRPDDSGGEPVLVWNHPGVLDPSAGLQPVEISPIARKRLNDRLAAANALTQKPLTLTLPLRLAAEHGGPVGVSGTELSVTYAVDAVAGGAQLTLRGAQRPLMLTVPAALRPAGGSLQISARHLGRELNGPVEPVAKAGGPGLLVTVGQWVATALPVVDRDGSASDLRLAAVTIDVGTDAPAELAVEVRADIHGLPGPLLAGAVQRLQPGPRATYEMLLDPQPATAPGSVVWVTARATTGAVRWYADALDHRPALPDVAQPAVRTSTDEGATWAPGDQRLSGPVAPRTRLLHRVEPPYGAPELTVRSGDSIVASIVLPPASGGAPDEFAVDAEPIAGALADLVGSPIGTRPTSVKTTITVHVATQAALDVRVTRVDLVYPPTAGPTGS